MEIKNRKPPSPYVFFTFFIAFMLLLVWLQSYVIEKKREQNEHYLQVKLSKDEALRKKICNEK